MKISKQLYNIIKDAASDHDVDFRENYSGRGMYGNNCFGLSGNLGAVMATLRHITEDCHEIEMNSDGESEIFTAEWMDMAFEYNQDSMGLGIIIYWPGVTGVYDEEEE